MRFVAVLAAAVPACVASVSVWFPNKERPRNSIFGFGHARNETRAKKWKKGEEEGKGKKENAYRQTPLQDLNNEERFSFVSECDGFLECFAMLGLARWCFFCFFAGWLKFSRIVIFRSKFQRMDCTLNLSYISYGELYCKLLTLSRLLMPCEQWPFDLPR